MSSLQVGAVRSMSWKLDRKFLVLPLYVLVSDFCHSWRAGLTQGQKIPPPKLRHAQLQVGVAAQGLEEVCRRVPNLQDRIAADHAANGTTIYSFTGALSQLNYYIFRYCSQGPCQGFRYSSSSVHTINRACTTRALRANDCQVLALR